MLFKKKIIPAELVSLELRYNENRSKLVRVFVPEHKKGEKCNAFSLQIAGLQNTRFVVESCILTKIYPFIP